MTLKTLKDIKSNCIATSKEGKIVDDKVLLLVQDFLNEISVSKNDLLEEAKKWIITWQISNRLIRKEKPSIDRTMKLTYNNGKIDMLQKFFNLEEEKLCKE